MPRSSGRMKHGQCAVERERGISGMRGSWKGSEIGYKAYIRDSGHNVKAMKSYWRIAAGVRRDQICTLEKTTLALYSAQNELVKQ